MALEHAPDDRTRQLLGRAQEASSSLVFVMEDLLRLTKTDDNASQQVGEETFNLHLTGMSHNTFQSNPLISSSGESHESFTERSATKVARIGGCCPGTITDHGQGGWRPIQTSDCVPHK